MEGSLKVSIANTLSRKSLKMPCNYIDEIARASWDHTVKLDLTMAHGIQFDILCNDPSPISHFTLYFKSGKGWYAHNFSIDQIGKWNSVKIPKRNMKKEGIPTSWSNIEKIRLSVWRGSSINTEFYITNFRTFGSDSPIAILLPQSISQTLPNELKSAIKFANNIQQILTNLGIDFILLDDINVTAEKLKNKQIIILPHNPNMNDKITSELIKYLQSGGKIITFYTLPEKIRQIVNIPRDKYIKEKYSGQFSAIHFDDKILKGAPKVVKQHSWNITASKTINDKSAIAGVWYNNKNESTGYAAVITSSNCILMTHVLLLDDIQNKEKMLLSMIGYFSPELVKKCAIKAINHIGTFASYKTISNAIADINILANKNPRIIDKIKEITTLVKKAQNLLQSKQYYKAIKIANETRKIAIATYCSVQKAENNEYRAWWCHDAFGVEGMSWDEAIKQLSQNGFTSILPNMLWGGVAYYKSNLLPIHEDVAKRGDQLTLCLNACKKYNIECHVWKVNWNMGYRTPQFFVDKMTKANRTQVFYDGTKKNRWLCPSHPENQKLEIETMIEVAKNYDVTGIHFDYIRYPYKNSCFCNGCRNRFEKFLGRKIANWPEDCRNNKEINKQWLNFRRNNITFVVKSVSDSVRKIKPNIKISAAVFRNWERDRDSVGQDWKLWCDKGYLDFVSPMDYMSSNNQFENILKKQISWAGKTPCYPGIGLSCWKPSDNICKLIEQIKISRKLNCRGFTIFNYSTSEAKNILPLCGVGITK